MPVRTASAFWDGSLKEGSGRIRLAGFDQPYTFASRFEEEAGTNPEELIGAAIAGCFSMALAADLGGAGHAPEKVETEAKVTVRPQPEGGFAITEIALDTTATVPGVTDAEFQTIASGTKENCPVSRALKAVPITLSAKLV
ncbi:MAG: OsmC family protein [Bauldia sp.]|nr:OsmC family protein [Bauldia sp.]